MKSLLGLLLFSVLALMYAAPLSSKEAIHLQERHYLTTAKSSVSPQWPHYSSPHYQKTSQQKGVNKRMLAKMIFSSRGRAKSSTVGSFALRSFAEVQERMVPRYFLKLILNHTHDEIGSKTKNSKDAHVSNYKGRVTAMQSEEYNPTEASVLEKYLGIPKILSDSLLRCLEIGTRSFADTVRSWVPFNTDSLISKKFQGLADIFKRSNNNNVLQNFAGFLTYLLPHSDFFARNQMLEEGLLNSLLKRVYQIYSSRVPQAHDFYNGDADILKIALGIAPMFFRETLNAEDKIKLNSSMNLLLHFLLREVYHKDPMWGEFGDTMKNALKTILPAFFKLIGGEELTMETRIRVLKQTIKLFLIFNNHSMSNSSLLHFADKLLPDKMAGLDTESLCFLSSIAQNILKTIDSILNGFSGQMEFEFFECILNHTITANRMFLHSIPEQINIIGGTELSCQAAKVNFHP